MKGSSDLRSEAVDTVDEVRLKLLELEHIVNQIHASRDFVVSEDEPAFDLECVTAILRHDLPNGLERVRNLLDPRDHKGGFATWILLYDDMVELKETLLKPSWTTDTDMMRKAFDAEEFFNQLWDQIEVQLDLAVVHFDAYRSEFARLFDWNATLPAFDQYHRLFDYFEKYFESYRDTRHQVERGDV
jgi:hypothetical protein